jgi:hypothetical protein
MLFKCHAYNQRLKAPIQHGHSSLPTVQGLFVLPLLDRPCILRWRYPGGRDSSNGTRCSWRAPFVHLLLVPDRMRSNRQLRCQGQKGLSNLV